jgi:hypothetical protein
MAQAQAAMAMASTPGKPGNQPPTNPSDALAQQAPDAQEQGQDTPKETKGDRASQGEVTALGKDGRSAYIGLPQRDRQAIMQSQTEKYPEEFGPEIERYLKSLADQSKPK